MFRIGIDLGGTNIAAGLVNEEYKIVAKKSVPTLATRGAEAIAADIAKLSIDLCAEHGIDIKKDVAAIGIASPGVAVRATGKVAYSNNLPFRDFPICQIVSDATGVADVCVENDANAAAWGEAVAGAAKGTTHSVMITLGTGVGGGAIIDGNMLLGNGGAGAEFGHVTLVAGGEECTCGRRGCLEAYASATALIRDTKRAMQANPDSLMWKI